MTVSDRGSPVSRKGTLQSNWHKGTIWRSEYVVMSSLGSDGNYKNLGLVLLMANVPVTYGVNNTALGDRQVGAHSKALCWSH